MAKRIKFPDLLPIYRSMKRGQGDSYTLEISNESIRESLTQALDESNSDESGISVRKGDYSSIQIKDVFIIDVAAPRVGLGILADSFAEYLKAPGSKIKERKNYFLLDSGFSCPSEVQPPTIVNKYRQLLRFIQLLSLSAHYLDEVKEELVFYREGRFIVQIQYTEEMISKLNFQVFESLERFILDPYHKEHKLKMLSDNLSNMLEGIAPNERLNYLILNISELLKRIQTSYELFVADHSYEKALAEVNSFRVETVTKIHKALTDIQAQILGIPIATFLALSQVKVTYSLNSQFATNTIIFMGVVIFCFLLAGFLINQHVTLGIIESEAQRQFSHFKSKFSNDPSIYKPSMQTVSSRLCWQRAAVYAIAALTILMLAISLVYYLVHTRPIFDIFF